MPYDPEVLWLGNKSLETEQAFCYGDFVNSHAQAALPGYFSITH